MLHKTEKLADHFNLRSGLPMRARVDYDEEGVVAQMITPGDINSYSNLIAVPMFLDGNHLELLRQEEDQAQRTDKVLGDDVTSSVRTRLLQRLEQRAQRERSAMRARAVDDSDESREDARRRFKERREQLDVAREAWRDLKRQERNGEAVSPKKRLMRQRALDEAREAWMEARRLNNLDRWGRDPADRVTPLTAVGNLYRELKLMWLSQFDVSRHALRSGDLLLVSKGQRPSLYVFWHPFSYEPESAELYEELIYVAHSSFVVISPREYGDDRSAALAAWLCGPGYGELMKINHPSSTGPWRAGTKQLYKLTVDTRVDSERENLARLWFRHYHGAISAQLEHEIQHEKFLQDQAQVLQGHHPSSSLYNLIDLKRQLIMWLARPDEPLEEERAAHQLELDVSQSKLYIRTPRFTPEDIEDFKLGLQSMQDDEVIDGIKAMIASTGLGFADFEPEFLKLVLYVGTVRSMELAGEVPWGPRSALWHHLIPLKRAVDSGDMYDSQLRVSLDDRPREEDPLVKLDEQMITLIGHLYKVLELTRDHRFLLQKLATTKLKSSKRSKKERDDDPSSDRLI